MKENSKGGAITEVTFFILLATIEPLHGYGILTFVEKITEGRLVLGAGTLYGALNTLVGKNLLSIKEEMKSDTKVTKLYLITESGKALLKNEISRLNGLHEIGLRYSKYLD